MRVPSRLEQVESLATSLAYFLLVFVACFSLGGGGGGGGGAPPSPPPPPPPPPAPAPRFPHPLVRRLGGDEDPDGPGLRGYCPFSLDLEPCEWRPVQLKPGAGSEKAPKEPRIKFLWG